MNTDEWSEKLVERRVSYNFEIDGKLVVIESVPARVNEETGEQLFSPDTVEHLQKLIWENSKRKRVIQVPVYECA
jgi:hypothetical protein